jgi:hypothetical protein
MEKISFPVRIFAILIVLAGAAGMLAMRTLSPSVDASAPIPQPVKRAQPSTAAKPAAKPAKTAATAPAAKATATKARQPAQTKAKPKPRPVVNPVVPPTGFPVAVDEALRQHRVVVVSLVLPGARVDELAAAEAEAGAKLGGAGFLALNVLNEKVARALLTKLDAAHDPSLLVVTRSGKVALELDGFVDRETVAQAAANASQ